MTKALFLSLALIFSLNQSTIFAQGTEEIGKAAYYADKLHGRPTASGKPYDKDQLTCSHKTYPFGTKLRITRMDNNQSVVVEVTDRGPYHDGFVVDLSRRAAEEIGMIKDGVVRVKVEPVGTVPAQTSAKGASYQVIKPQTTQTAPAVTSPKSPAPVTYSTETPVQPAQARPGATVKPAPVAKGVQPSAPAKTATQQPASPTAASKAARSRDLYQVSVKKPLKQGFAVQVSVVSTSSAAMDAAAKLEEKFPGRVMVLVESDDTPGGAQAYKLLIGPYADRKAADNAHSEVIKKGYKKAFIIDLSAQ